MTRFAVIGLGEIARQAVLPAFARVPGAQLTALVSRDRSELRELGRKYRVPRLYTLRDLDNCLLGGYVDAVYIALPNDLHCEYAIRAANAYKHVLCEKPLALTVEQARRMETIARRRHVKLMTAYRLLLEPATREAIRLARSGRLGDLRGFNSVFGFPLLDRKNIRLSAARGGGALNDLGGYPINAARHLFGAEPTEVFAVQPSASNPMFAEVDESTTAMLRFPGGRTATFTVSFNLARTCRFELHGTKGKLVMDPAYFFSEPPRLEATIGGRTTRKSYRSEQFAALLEHFVSCIESEKEPVATAAEAIADLRVIEAIKKSARLKRVVKL